MKNPIRILVVNPAPIYPVKAMNQKRTHHMMQTLAQNFSVDLATPVNQEEEIAVADRALKDIGGIFVNLGSIKQSRKIVRKRFAQIKRFLAYYLAGHDREYTNSKLFRKKTIDLINKEKYAMVISNYWEGSSFFNELDHSIYRIFDPHYAVAENREVLENKNLKGLLRWVESRKLRKSMRLEKAVIEAADLLLPLSRKNLEEFEKIAPLKPMLLIPDGSDVELFSSFPVNPDPNTILFYGAMGSAQNVNACKRLINKIYPALKEKYPKLRLLIVGNRPAEEIRMLHDGKNVIVTGFVEDVRPWLAQAWIKVIPLELGSGFRGRVIELMAMGIPVIGTHNALDSIEMENGKHGFISDSDEGMTKYSLELLNNHHARNEISRNGVDFIKKNYSLDSTFGKLNVFLKKMPLNRE